MVRLLSKRRGLAAIPLCLIRGFDLWWFERNWVESRLKQYLWVPSPPLFSPFLSFSGSQLVFPSPSTAACSLREAGVSGTAHSCAVADVCMYYSTSWQSRLTDSDGHNGSPRPRDVLGRSYFAKAFSILPMSHSTHHQRLLVFVGYGDRTKELPDEKEKEAGEEG